MAWHVLVCNVHGKGRESNKGRAKNPTNRNHENLLPELVHAELARVHAVVEERRLVPVVIVRLQQVPRVCRLAAQLPHVERLRARARDHAALVRLRPAQNQVHRREQLRAHEARPATSI